MEGQGNSNWPKSETSGSLGRKLNELLTDFEGDNDMSPAELYIKEEMVLEEVMQELHKEIRPSASTKPTTWPTSFPSPSSSPLSTSLFSLTPLPFANSEGKSESCGASQSDSASTVMAGIEFVGSAVKIRSPDNGFWGVVEGGGCNYEVGVGESFGETLDGCDGGELDDEWLGRLLRWDPPLLDDHCSSS
jgi:hypothetical protein